MTLGVFCGGFSPEFDISLRSADTIISALPKELNTVKIIVSREVWMVQLPDGETELDLNSMSFTDQNKQTVIINLGLVYVHGNPGENGKIQAFLEMKNIPCINTGALASELSFDKWFCNQFLKGFGIDVAKSILFTHPYEHAIKSCIEKLGLPLFVKPCDSGSSFGISKVKSEDDLQEAILKAFEEGETVVLEAFLKGTEVTCGVYRNESEMVALPLTEIVPETEYFDYEAKYLGKSKEITPARISEEISKKIQEISKKIYKLIRLRSIVRLDFIVVNDKPYLVEVNTTPGFSAASIVPQMIKVHGLSLEKFWREIVSFECPMALVKK